MSTEAPKRFYKEAALFEDGGGFGVALDSRPVKTPAGAEFRVPTRALAKAIAQEWSAQSERILFPTMPLTRLAYAAIDHGPANRESMADHVAKYGETDLACHRVASPAALAKRQAAAWDPALAFAATLGVKPPLVVGVIKADVSEEAVAALRAHAQSLDNFRLTALAQATGAAGSALIALALAHGQFDASAAFNAATVDEQWSLETWGEDAEARERLDKLRAEFDALARFVAALN